MPEITIPPLRPGDARKRRSLDETGARARTAPVGDAAVPATEAAGG